MANLNGSIETANLNGSIETASLNGSIETVSLNGSIETASLNGSIETTGLNSSIEVKKRIVGNVSIGRGIQGEKGEKGDNGDTLTDEQQELLSKIPYKFDGVISTFDGEKTILDFEADGKIVKSVEVIGGGSTGGVATRGTLSTTFVSGTTVGQKDMVLIPYVFETENIGVATLFVNITCGLKSKELEFEVKKIGAGNVNLGILDKGINNISMYIVDASKKMTNIITFDVVCGALEISSTFDAEQDFNDYSAITIPVVVDALVEDGNKLYVNIDGTEFIQDVANGYNAFVFPAEFKVVGVHAVTMQVKNGDTLSNVINFNVIIVSSTNILISTANTSLAYEEGVKFNIPYRVSIQGYSLLNVEYWINGEKDGATQEIKVGNNEYVADYSKFPKGDYTLKIKVSTLDGTISSELSIHITIVENSFQRIEFVKNGLEAFFNMSKNSNTSPDKNILYSDCLNYKGQRYSLNLHDYNYNTNGWIDGRLVSNGTAWAEIDMKPFTDNVTGGFTFDISYSASNMGDDDNVVLECIGQEIPNGILIDSAKYNIKTESNSLSGYYTNDKDTRITFVVHRTSTYLDKWLTDDLGNLVENPNPVRKNNPMVQVYIDGILSEVAMLSDSGTGANKIYESILNEETILINTDRLKKKFGVSKIKTIAIYNRPLEHEEVLQNLMADIDDLIEQKAKYDKNYVTINQDIPTIYINDSSIGKWSDTTKDNKQYLEVTYSSPNVEKFGPSFESISQTAWQGTSSLAYPVKNIKLKLYDYQTDSEGNPINTTDKNTFKKKKIDLFGARDGNGYPEQVFTIKVDYMDSSHCRNTGTARMTTDFLFDGNPNPAKQKDPKTRDAINGIPVQIYINGEWIGLGNLNHDKSCFKSLGMETIPNTVRWEIKANTDTSEGAFYKTWKEGNIEEIYSKILADFEIVYDEDAFEENSGEFDLTKYYKELKIPYSGDKVIGGYKDYSILSLARYIQFVSDTTDKEEFRQKAPQYFNVDRACRYYLNVMLMGMIDNFAKNTIINMYGDDIWWYSFYDLDSQLSLDNTGYRKFREDIEPSHEGVYNCSTSKMWVKLNDFFQEELFNNFLVMRNGEYTYENICRYLIDLQIDQFPEIAYNKDIYAKYIAQGRRYLHMLHGNDKAHILRWLYNRFLYVDSLFLQQNSPYTKQSITIRSCKPISGSAIENLPSGVQYRPKFLIETYVPQYVTICWRKNTYVTKRVGWGETVEFSYDMTNTQDNELIVYCAGNLKRIGDCTDKNPTSIDIASAFKLVEFKCENSDKLLKADLSKNSYLRKVSFNGCTNLGNTTGGANVLDVSSCTNLRSIDIRNTSITSILTNTDGGNIEEIYYPSKIQNVVVANLTNLRVVGLPTGENIAENLSTVQIVNCGNIKTLKYPYEDNEPVDFSAIKYTQNLIIENSLNDMESLSFRGFNKLRSVTLKNMLKLKACGFDDMLGADETPTLKNITINTCPLIETLTLKVSSNDSIVAFDNAILDLRNATTIKRIESNTALIGLKSIYLPNSITDLIFALDYHTDLVSDITNIWSSSSVQDNINSDYSGIDFKDLTIKNLDLSSLKAISNVKNIDNLKPTEILKLAGLKITGTIDLTNYTGSYVEMFKNADLRGITFICNKDITVTDFTSMFEGATIGECDLSPIIRRIKNPINFSYMFRNTDITQPVIKEIGDTVTNIDNMYSGCSNLTDISGMTFGSGIVIFEDFLPHTVTTANDITVRCNASLFKNNKYIKYMNNISRPNLTDWTSFFEGCTSLISDIIFPTDTTNTTNCFKGCTSMTHIHSNWNNTYDGEITATDCYSGCTAITHIDDVDLGVNEYISGLDEVPVDWGGYGFDRNTTGTYVVVIPSDNYEVIMGAGTVSDAIINWGDGNVTTNVFTHTYATAGTYVIKGKCVINYNVSYPDASIANTLTKIIKYPENPISINRCYFAGCTKLTYVNISNCKFPPSFENAFYNCTSLTTIEGIETLDTSHITTLYNMFNGCSSLTSLDLSNWDVENVTNTQSIFSGCSSLTSLNLSGWVLNNINATSLNYMFRNCQDLEEIIGLETLMSRTKKYVGHMAYTFENCYKLKRLDLKLWNVVVAGNHGACFKNCYNIEYFDFSGIDFRVLGDGAFGDFAINTDTKTISLSCPNYTSSSLFRVFSQQANFSSINFEGSNFESVTNIEQCFGSNTVVKSISFKNTNLNNVTSWNYCFTGTTNLENLNLDGCTIIADIKISSCSKLTVTSLVSVLNALCNNTGNTTKTCTLGSTNLAKLSASQIKIATDKNWTLA